MTPSDHSSNAALPSGFRKFVLFGGLGTETERQQLARGIWNFLKVGGHQKPVLPKGELAPYASAIAQLLQKPALCSMAGKDPVFAEQATIQILDFLNSLQMDMAKAANPHQEEESLSEEFAKVSRNRYKETWEKAYQFLKESYDEKTLAADFYREEFGKALAKDQPRGQTKEPEFDDLKNHLVTAWQEQIFLRKSAHELHLIDEGRKKFMKEFYKKIDEMEELASLLGPFSDQLGRMFDLSLGAWSRVNFDILKKYHELFQKSDALKALADLLGKLNQADKEFEEEKYKDIEIQEKWVVNPAGKADLIGVRESADLNSMLPSEIALLSDPDTEWLFFKKLAEKRLQTFEFHGQEKTLEELEVQKIRRISKKQGKGPFIICVDTSGSMHGAPELVAKTLCFAILKMATEEKRACFLIFSQPV